MVTVSQLILDPGAADPKKVTTEELDPIRCRVVVSAKNRRNRSWTWGWELASLGEKVFPLTPTSRVSHL